MNIIQSKPKNLVSIITIEITQEDYTDKVNSILKDYQKNAVIPGFRKGKTPFSMISKKYRTNVLAEEINKIMQDALYKHITNSKEKVLGSPLPIENQSINWDSDKDFIFKYEIGLSPAFDLKITKKDTLDYYNITADKEIVDQYCSDIAKRYGSMISVETSTKGDLLFCQIDQLDDKSNVIKEGISSDANVSIDFISKKSIEKRFIGVNKGDIIKANVKDAFSNETDLASMLKISKEELKSLNNDNFQFTVKSINRMQPAELKEELFNKVYPGQKIPSLKLFRSKIKKEAENQFVQESDRMLKNDIVTYLLDKNKIALPDDFLKRWLLKTSEQPITKEILESQYEMYSKSLKWQLIENKIIEDNNIKIEQEQVKKRIKELVQMQMKQYNQLSSTNDEEMNKIVDNVFKDEKERKKLYDQMYDEKTMDLYKQKFNLKKKSVSYNDFVKLASEK